MVVIRNCPPPPVDPIVWAKRLTPEKIGAMPHHMQVEAAALMLEAGYVRETDGRLRRLVQKGARYSLPVAAELKPEKTKSGETPVPIGRECPGFPVRNPASNKAQLLQWMWQQPNHTVQAGSDEIAAAAGYTGNSGARAAMSFMVSAGLVEPLAANGRKNAYRLTESGVLNAKAMFGEEKSNA